MRLSVILGDLTEQQVDAIVNAANASLAGGGGVDGAIQAAAGPELAIEGRRLRRARWPDGFPVGQAVATDGYQLPARWVIHTVGPNWNQGERDPADLASCYTESIRVGAELGAVSLAFPSISAGSYGWSVEQVAQVAVTAVRGIADSGSVEDVRFVVFDERGRTAFERALAEGSSAVD
jgi:O-acetyl-ADP-ribose deacetylase (regulator of RNase III)